jgi:murein DD-endopeptidase MepM/ murein hydrolase activator NlpD
MNLLLNLLFFSCQSTLRIPGSLQGLGRIPTPYPTKEEIGPKYQFPAEGRISSKFGMRVHPISKKKKMHKGLDIAAPKGTPIYPISNGIVSFSGVQSGYGNIVIINHGNGLTSRYAHCHKRHVQEGEKVQQNDMIATVGKTGTATGNHLHLEIRKDNSPLDPLSYLSH